MAKGDYLTKPQFGTPKDDIERAACTWLEANVGTTGETVMQSLTAVMRGLIRDSHAARNADGGMK